MITATGNQYHRKEASLLGHFAIPAAVHIGQNLVTKAQLGLPRLHKQLASAFKRKAGLSSLDDVGGELLVSSQSGLIPEVGILNKEIGHIGGRLKDAMSRTGLDPANLGREQLQVLKDAAQGKFMLLERKGQLAKHRDLVGSVLSSAAGDTGRRLGSMLASKNLPKNLTKDLEKMWTKNPLTGKLLSGVAARLSDAGTGRAISEAKKNLLHRGGDAAGIVATTIMDPATGAINAGKKFMASDKITFAPVKKLQSSLNKRFVGDPLKKMTQQGLAGEAIPFRGVRRFVDSNLMNPLVSDAKNLAYDAGRLVHKYQG